MKDCLCKKLTTPMIIVLVILAVVLLFVILHLSVGVLNFFTTYKDVLVGIGYVLVFLGLFLTASQIGDARRQAKANLSY